MKKTIVYSTIIIAFLVLTYYLISPLWRTVEVQEESPLINDRMKNMSASERAEFDEAVEEANKDTTTMEDNMPDAAQLLAQGIFKPRAHSVEGSALLIQDGDSKILRFEDFETVNGPNLHIYLASSLGEDDFIDLGKIKATKGNVNYELPDGIDFERYDKVLVWCVPFKVLFSYAELEE